ncbi:hypothetical protein [Streptomyces iranensis]|uniref:hypothetical protein n=1 Tax=Streptomyces iranensis TaxID=576784 RepID=UPI0039B7243D
MKSFIGHHEVATDTDYLELALGTPLELWLGEEGESAKARTARLDAARDILADDPELYDHVVRLAARALDEAGWLRLAPSVPERFSPRTGVAA